MSGSDMTIAELTELVGRLGALRPCPRAIMAHHSVPYGRSYRQWDTEGRMLVWANQGEIADVRRYAVLDQFGTYSFGIPVYNASAP